MLGPGRYLLGIVEILVLVASAWQGAARVRSWSVPSFEGAPAHVATAVVALALLIWVAEALGSFGAFDPVPYMLLVAMVGLGLWKFLPRPPEGGGPHPYHPGGGGGPPHPRLGGGRPTSLRRDEREWRALVPTSIAFLIALAAVIRFAAGVKMRLSTGMTGFDSTWYHGPFAAGFMQSGDTWDLHFIAPQFLAWFYPANGEIFHAVGMLAFGRDILSPLLNLGWFVGCLVACWCIGRPYRVAPWSLTLGAIALSVPALSDQAGEARNDIVGIFFLLAAVAVALNAWSQEGLLAGRNRLGNEGGGAGAGPYLVVGLAAGLAAGTKLNFLLPAAVLVLGLVAIAPAGTRWRSLAAGGLAALAGGGYWYLRNLVHAGNPLPWIHHLGPISLPAPEQGLGGREAHSVLGYLTDASVWSDWFLPGLHHGLWLLWPLLLAAALAGLVLSLLPPPRRRADLSISCGQIGPSAGEGWAGPLAVAGLVGVASGLAWLIAPTSASGPDGLPRGFESGLRYLAPALVLGLTLLPTTRPLRQRLPRLAAVWSSFLPDSDRKLDHTYGVGGRQRLVALGAGLLALFAAIAVGYPVQRHYLRDRYADPTFAAPGLDAAFAWARNVSDARIATTSTRQYPLFGSDLSNRVEFLGVERAHGGFEAPTSCRQFRRLLDDGRYDYVVATRDRLELGKPAYPAQAQWTEGPGAEVILRKPPTVVVKLKDNLDPSGCP